MTRAEHLAWAKGRAQEYVDAGDPAAAFMSLVSDLRKHEALQDHAAIELGVMLQFSGNLSTAQEMRDFIEGCN